MSLTTISEWEVIGDVSDEHELGWFVMGLKGTIKQRLLSFLHWSDWLKPSRQTPTFHFHQHDNNHKTTWPPCTVVRQYADVVLPASWTSWTTFWPSWRSTPTTLRRLWDRGRPSCWTRNARLTCCSTACCHRANASSLLRIRSLLIYINPEAVKARQYTKQASRWQYIIVNKQINIQICKLPPCFFVMMYANWKSIAL